MENRVDMLVELILENDLLFDVVTTWKSLPVFYKIWESDDLYRMNIELSEADVEDCYSVADKVTKELQTYYGNSFSISVDCIVEFLRIHRNTIMKAIVHKPSEEITLLINKIGYTVTINKLCKTLLNNASLSSDVRIIRIIC